MKFDSQTQGPTGRHYCSLVEHNSYLHRAGGCKPGRRPPSPHCSLPPDRPGPPSSSSWSWSRARRRCCSRPSCPRLTTDRSPLGRGSRSPSLLCWSALCGTSRRASPPSSRSCPGRSAGSASYQTLASNNHGLQISSLLSVTLTLTLAYLDMFHSSWVSCGTRRTGSPSVCRCQYTAPHRPSDRTVG